MPSRGGNLNNLRPAPKPASPPPVMQRLASAVANVGSAVSRAPSSVSRTVAPVRVATSRRAAAPTARAPVSTRAFAALDHAQRQFYGGHDRAFVLPTDPVMSDASASRYRNVVRQLQTQGAFNQDFASLQGAGLISRTEKQPPVSFPSRGMGAQGALPYEKNNRIYVSPVAAEAASDPQSPLHAWGMETLIHELAHTMQPRQVLQSVPLREGGAQAFADAAAPAVLGPIPTNDTNYSGYVRRARARGPAWYMRGQFQGS